MRTEELAGIYQSKSDDELLALAQSEGLTPEAEFVLRNEMARRGIRFETEVEISETRRCEPILESEVAGSMLRQAHSVTEFTGAVTRMYRGHFVLFFKLTVPAIAIGFIAFTIARREGGELLRQFFGESSSNRNLLLLKVRLIADAWQLAVLIQARGPELRSVFLRSANGFPQCSGFLCYLLFWYGSRFSWECLLFRATTFSTIHGPQRDLDSSNRSYDHVRRISSGFSTRVGDARCHFEQRQSGRRTIPER
ncbi:MAG TPA: hypothetical protein VG897_16455 [Terriglobales bacterium]|nr:hypothetical protein [Terriglobales bacterium]